MHRAPPNLALVALQLCKFTERRLMVQRTPVRVTFAGERSDGLVARGIYFDESVAGLVALFGQRLRAQRQQLGLSQPMLYEKTGGFDPLHRPDRAGKGEPLFRRHGPPRRRRRTAGPRYAAPGQLRRRVAPRVETGSPRAVGSRRPRRPEAPEPSCELAIP